MSYPIEDDDNVTVSSPSHPTSPSSLENADNDANRAELPNVEITTPQDILANPEGPGADSTHADPKVPLEEYPHPREETSVPSLLHRRHSTPMPMDEDNYQYSRLHSSRFAPEEGSCAQLHGHGNRPHHHPHHHSHKSKSPFSPMPPRPKLSRLRTRGSTHVGISTGEGPLDGNTEPKFDSFGNPVYDRVYDDEEEASEPEFPTTAFETSIGSAIGGDGGDGEGESMGGADRHSPFCTQFLSLTDWMLGTRFTFLRTRTFWFLVEYALRVSILCMMTLAILLDKDFKHSPFYSTTSALTSVVIATGTTFGQASSFFVQYIKAGCIWLPLATACVAAKLHNNFAMWLIVYTLVLFLMAVFTERMTRRMCLLLFNIAMVSALSGNHDLTMPSRTLADWFIGAAFALAATLIPYPMLATKHARQISNTLFDQTSFCFSGVIRSFWSVSNTQRGMTMVGIRRALRHMDRLVDAFEVRDSLTFYEMIFFETSERRQVRKDKNALVLTLKMNLRSMERVVKKVQDRPQMLAESQRCILFREHLSMPMDSIVSSVDTLLMAIRDAKMRDDLQQLDHLFEECGCAIKALQEQFDVARRVLFYQSTHGDERVATFAAAAVATGEKFSDVMEEFVPLMTSFVFGIVNFYKSLHEYEMQIRQQGATGSSWMHIWVSIQSVFFAIVEPFFENARLIRDLPLYRRESDWRIVVEAAKVSVSMMLSVIFFYYVEKETLLLSGPSIIAFVSGTNPVEAMNASAARLTGTLLGSVLGFFAASLCTTTVQRIASLCTITAVMTFFRPLHSFGTICMYCNFVAVSNLGPVNQTAETTISRIMQNTFAIGIYCIISVSVFPLSPGRVLLNKRLQVVEGITETVATLLDTLTLPGEVFHHHGDDDDPDAAKGASTGPANTTAAAAAAAAVFNTSGIVGNSSVIPMISNASRLLPPSPRNMGTYSFAPLARARVSPTQNLSTATPTQPMIPVGEDTSNSNSNGAGNGRNATLNAPLAPSQAMSSPGTGGPSRWNQTELCQAFVGAPDDPAVNALIDSVYGLLAVMKSTDSIMPLAAEEFYVVPKVFPGRASTELHASLYNLCSLTYTMGRSLKALREEGYFHREMRHIFHNLRPVSLDLASCLTRFSTLLIAHAEASLTSPMMCSSGLAPELTQTAVDVQLLCSELNARKQHDLMRVAALANLQRRHKKRQGRHKRRPPAAGGREPADEEEGSAFTPGLGPRRDPSLTAQLSLMPSVDGHEPYDPAASRRGSRVGRTDRLSSVASATHNNSTSYFDFDSGSENSSCSCSRCEATRCRRSRSRERRRSEGVPRLNSMVPFGDAGMLSPTDVDGIDDSFAPPVTVVNAEGLHTFTFALEMLGKEVRRVLYEMEEMLQAT